MGGDVLLGRETIVIEDDVDAITVDRGQKIEMALKRSC